MNEKDELEKKKKFTAPETIKFAKKVTVDSINELVEKSPKTTQKSAKLNSSLQPKGPSDKSKKLTLRPEDIKISLKTKIERIKKERKKITVKSAIEAPPIQEDVQVDAKSVEPSLEKVEIIEPIEYPEHDVNLTDVIMTYGNFDFSKELQKLIVKKGSTLNAELCEKFISEVLDSLEEALKYEDLKFAAEIFVKIEKELII